MGKFKAISKSFERMSDFTITLDKQQRVCLNTSLRRELDHQSGQEYYLFYDETEGRIGLSKYCGEEEEIEPYRFDERGYASASGFIRQTDFNTANGFIQFIFDGIEGDIYAFRLPGRKSVSLKQEKNGNLQRA